MYAYYASKKSTSYELHAHCLKQECLASLCKLNTILTTRLNRTLPPEGTKTKRTEQYATFFLLVFVDAIVVLTAIP